MAGPDLLIVGALISVNNLFLCLFVAWGEDSHLPSPRNMSKHVSVREAGILGAHVPLDLPSLHPSLCPLIHLFMKYHIQDKKVTDQGTLGFFFQAENALYFHPCQTVDQFVAETKVH